MSRALGVISIAIALALPHGRERLVFAPDTNEFKAGFHKLIADELEARHTYIRSGRPQTNGHVERRLRGLSSARQPRGQARGTRVLTAVFGIA